MEFCVRDDNWVRSFCFSSSVCVGQYLVSIEGDERFAGDFPLSVADARGLEWFADQYERLSSMGYQHVDIMEAIYWVFCKYGLNSREFDGCNIALFCGYGGAAGLFAVLGEFLDDGALWGLLDYEQIGIWYYEYRSSGDGGVSGEIPKDIVGSSCADMFRYVDHESPSAFFEWAEERDAPVDKFVNIDGVLSYMSYVRNGLYVCIYRVGC